ncbi:hypothetical protein K435DRAFT_878852 [Dendrothele bispora CBS 962.96]|uniref:Uncharacterized protein n=1 Tax=Dendrothele bispora (strain CBS 962.96) TaxID=1314807 RepID=A0A4S8KMH1_DENBC|nr:hypothetical protein K435DRAFT_878852 [Dendrothele bispora CBS 962.96]
MATQTEVTTETTTQGPPTSNHPSQVPHNSGFSTYTPDGRWQQGNQSRRSFETPSRGLFHGDGRLLRPSSAPPNPSEKKEHIREGTPDAPLIRTTQLPTPDPTGPRIRQVRSLPRTPESRNYENLRKEVLSVDPRHTFRGNTYIPESVLEEIRAQNVLTGSNNDPRSPQEDRTPAS